MTTNQTHNRIPTPELLNELHRLANTHGEPLKRKTMDEHGKYSSHTYLTRFGSWSDALDEADVEGHDRGRPELTKTELIEELQRLADEHDRTPSSKLMQAHGDYSVKTYHNKFESWNAAVEQAGFEPRTPPTQTPKEDLLDELHRLANTHGEPLKRQTMNEHGDYTADLYDVHFDSWSDALDEADVEGHDRGRPELTKTELVEELNRLTTELGHPPTTSDMNEHGEYSHLTYYNTFGDWDSALDHLDA